MNTINTLRQSTAVASKLTRGDLYELAGTNKLPERLVFSGHVFDGTLAYVSNPIESIEAYSKAVYETFEWTEREEAYPGFTYDDLCVILNEVVSRIEGFVSQAVATSPMDKPSTRRVPIGYNHSTGEMEYVVVPDGAMSLPFRKAGKTQPWIRVEARYGTPYIVANVIRGDQTPLEGVFEAVRRLATHYSIYLGQVIDTNFNFVDMTRFDESKVALTKKMRTALAHYVHGPLKHMSALQSKRQDTKTGLLLQGPPGGGKTMTVSLCEKTAISFGAAVIHCDPSSGIDGMQKAQAIGDRLMRAGHMVMIVFEDVEKLATQDRAKVLEILDGATVKNAHRIVIGTTNFIEQIDRAMIRHGRFDDVLYCGLPDLDAFTQVIHHSFDADDLDDIDFEFAFPYFEGYSYATIGNALSKVVRAAISRTDGDLSEFKVTTADLVEAAQLVRDQHNLMNEDVVKERPFLDDYFKEVLDERFESLTNFVDEATDKDTTDYGQVEYVAERAADSVVEGRLDGAALDVDGRSGSLHTQ